MKNAAVGLLTGSGSQEFRAHASVRLPCDSSLPLSRASLRSPLLRAVKALRHVVCEYWTPYGYRSPIRSLFRVPRNWSWAHADMCISLRPPAITFANGDLLVTPWDFANTTSLARVVEGTGALEERQGVIPSLGTQTQMLMTGAFWNSAFAPAGDQIFAMFEVSNALYAWKRGARDAREIVLPVLRRRGVPQGLFQTLLQDPGRATPAMIYDRSAPVALAAVSGDIVGIVTMDVKVDAEKWSSIHFLTLYDHRRHRVCADVPGAKTQWRSGSRAPASSSSRASRQGCPGDGSAASAARRRRSSVATSGVRWLKSRIGALIAASSRESDGTREVTRFAECAPGPPPRRQSNRARKQWDVIGGPSRYPA